MASDGREVGFNVPNCMNGKRQWPTLLSQRRDIESPKIIRFIRTALSCITSLENSCKISQTLRSGKSSAHGMRFGNTDPEK